MKTSAFQIFFVITGLCLFSTPLIAQQDSTVQKEIEVSFENACQDTILVLLHYKNSESGWVTKGWYWVPPGETRFVARTSNALLYYHARNIKGDQVWKDNENGWKFKDKVYGFRQIAVDEKVWDYTKRLVCE